MSDTSDGDKRLSRYRPNVSTESWRRDVEPIGEDSSDSSGTKDGIVRSFEDMPIDLNDVCAVTVTITMLVRIDRISD
ncbi:hypothetical protein Tco_1309846 [Tanacetum coccineum]